jgi:hypothetical protein
MCQSRYSMSCRMKIFENARANKACGAGEEYVHDERTSVATVPVLLLMFPVALQLRNPFFNKRMMRLRYAFSLKSRSGNFDLPRL